MKPRYWGLDYETFSDVELGGPNARGLPNYIASENFRALIASIYDVENDAFYTYDWVFNCIWHAGGTTYEENSDDTSGITMNFMLIINENCDKIVAHNVGFERAVTKWMLGDNAPLEKMVDSAVAARALGAAGKLEVASRQLTNTHKKEVGAELIQLFCVPNEFYPNGPTKELIEKHGHMNKWLDFIDYCEVDAKAGWEIYKLWIEMCDKYHPGLVELEEQYEWCIYEMNNNGWGVDQPLVEKMRQRSWANSIIAQKMFVNESGEQLNFNSHPQMKKYCADRGFPIKSLDKYHLPAYIEQLTVKLATEELAERERRRLGEMLSMLETKQEIGGSTLSKLPVIQRLVSEDGILRDQYMHIGAPQTYRVTGRGVQMQNLKKLNVYEDGSVRDTDTLYDFEVDWSNQEMADQLRQVFVARHPEGEVIVGDFISVESRGLAFIAGEEWKLDAYREGKDIYKVLASIYFGVPYEEVTKEQRPRGKYSELSCGYQASAIALMDFMFRLGFVVPETQALEDVMNWRTANPNIANLWRTLDLALKDSVRYNQVVSLNLANQLGLKISPFALQSMQEQHPNSLSLCIQLYYKGKPFLTRFIHGCYFKQTQDGMKLCYYKPSEKLNGDLWVKSYKHPKKKDKHGNPLNVLYGIFGGKLSGILTQSFCRELYYDHLLKLTREMKKVPNALIVGTFHDETAVDWWPGEWTRDEVKALVEKTMSESPIEGFPLVADVKSAHRYIK